MSSKLPVKNFAKSKSTTIITTRSKTAANKQVTKQADKTNEKHSNGVKSIQKPSAPKTGMNANKMTKKNNSTFADRRGISEIKRSEAELKLKVSTLENDIKSLKDELETINSTVENKDVLIEELNSKMEEHDKLLEEIENNYVFLESLNIDPVEHKTMNVEAINNLKDVSQFTMDMQNACEEIDTACNSIIEQVSNIILVK